MLAPVSTRQDALTPLKIPSTKGRDSLSPTTLKETKLEQTYPKKLLKSGGEEILLDLQRGCGTPPAGPSFMGDQTENPSVHPKAGSQDLEASGQKSCPD